LQVIIVQQKIVQITDEWDWCIPSDSPWSSEPPHWQSTDAGGCTVLCRYSPCRRCMEVVLYGVVTHRAVAAWSCPVTDADDTAAVNSLK